MIKTTRNINDLNDRKTEQEGRGVLMTVYKTLTSLLVRNYMVSGRAILFFHSFHQRLLQSQTRKVSSSQMTSLCFNCLLLNKLLVGTICYPLGSGYIWVFYDLSSLLNLMSPEISRLLHWRVSCFSPITRKLTWGAVHSEIDLMHTAHSFDFLWINWFGTTYAIHFPHFIAE